MDRQLAFAFPQQVFGRNVPDTFSDAGLLGLGCRVWGLGVRKFIEFKIPHSGNHRDGEILFLMGNLYSLSYHNTEAL